MAFKRILCAVDFSRDSVAAFNVGVQMARRDAAALHVFHVIEAEPSVSVGEAVVRVLEQANAALERLLSDVAPALDGLAVTSEVTSGFAADEIVGRARGWKADLVVLGSKGAPTFEDLGPGETVEGVVEQAPCSVLAVRGQ